MVSEVPIYILDPLVVGLEQAIKVGFRDKYATLEPPKSREKRVVREKVGKDRREFQYIPF